MTTALLFLVVLFQLIVLIGGCSAYIIGRQLPLVVQRKKPVEYYSRMFKAIYKIAPRKTLKRLGWNFVGAFAFYALFSSPARENPDLKKNVLLCFDIANIGLLLIALIFFFLAQKKKKTERKKWVHIWMEAHLNEYNKPARIGKYGSIEEIFLN